MKLLVIGGSSGLGLAISKEFSADQISRSNGYTIPDSIEQAIAKSLDYDVVINCLPDSNQNKLLFPMYEAHDQKGRSTYFITVGSMSWRFSPPQHSKRELFDWSEGLILRNTKLKHTLLNPAFLWNSKNQGQLAEISQKDMLLTIDFLLRSNYNNSVISLIEIKGPYKNAN